MTTKINTLPTVGARVGTVCGPCESPKDNAGMVMCHINDEWGTRAVVMMDDGKVKNCHGLTKVGIGWYAL